jgi:capsular exopolysaccharide synthesis family protein
MELSTYIGVIKRRFSIIVITASIAVIIVLLGRLLAPPSYESTAKIRIIPYAVDDPPYSQLVYAERVMNTYVEYATSQPVLDEVRERMGLYPGRFINISVEIIPDSELLLITVTDSDPNIAMNVANTLIGLLQEHKLMRDIQINVIEPAELPRGPSLRSAVMFIGLAVVVGLAGGFGVAFLIDYLDTTIYSPEDVKNVTDLPILVEIPKRKSRSRGGFEADFQTNKDVYVRFRTHVFSLLRETSLKTLAITSTEPYTNSGEVISNLAYSMALTGKKLLIVDADFGNPLIGEFFGLDNENGLSQVLSKGAGLIKSIQNTEFSSVKVLVSGPTHLNASELLGSEKMMNVLVKVKERFDFVLINVPTVLQTADSLVLLPLLDAVILVGESGITSEQSLEKSLEQIEIVGGNLIGIVVNYEQDPMSRGFVNLLREQFKLRQTFQVVRENLRPFARGPFTRLRFTSKKNQQTKE